MNQSEPLYDMASALETLEPWLDQHLPTLDPVARRHFAHLVTGVIEQQSLLVGAIAAASPFQAEPESNYTQVQRIIQDTRLHLESVYYPLLEQLLAALPDEQFFVTMDETNHGKDFNLVLVGLATDGVSLPLGFLVYAIDAEWADDARQLLTRLDRLIPVDTHPTAAAEHHQARLGTTTGRTQATSNAAPSRTTSHPCAELPTPLSRLSPLLRRRLR